MRRRKRSRKWPGKAPRKIGWAKVRRLIPNTEPTAKVLDHVVCERWVLTYQPKMNPHEPVNLMWLTPEKHGIKLGADRKFCRGDLLGYLERLRTNGWPMDCVEAALRHYKLIK